MEPNEVCRKVSPPWSSIFQYQLGGKPISESDHPYLIITCHGRSTYRQDANITARANRMIGLINRNLQGTWHLNYKRQQTSCASSPGVLQHHLESYHLKKIYHQDWKYASTMQLDSCFTIAKMFPYDQRTSVAYRPAFLGEKTQSSSLIINIQYLPSTNWHTL